MYAIARRIATPLFDRGTGLGGSVVWLRGASSNARKRLRAFRHAQENPHTSPTKLKKLRERCATPSHDLLRHLAENKIGKAMTTADRRAVWFDMQHRQQAPLFLGQMRPRMQLWTAALEESQLPLARLPEVAVAGRSNSGKSTLVNYLCGQHSAHVRRLPGSTTELVFWKIGRPAQLCLVDLPGYGFAMAPEERRLQWTEFTLWYVRSRRNLRRVLLLIDARQGLKPSDKEMIAYLERCGVAWQLIVTKCDKVVPKELAKRLTVLDQDTTDYHKMAGRPIPISALKRKGMQALRDTLDSLKVQKEVVKEGIRRNVYDLLELRRCRRAEKARKKREAAEAVRRQEAAEAAAAEDLGLADDAGGDGAERGGRASDRPVRDDLHAVLDEWRSEGDGAPGGEAPDAASAPSPRPLVAELRYQMDDRDSRRVDGFMHGLFPELPDAAPGVRPGVHADGPQTLAHAHGPGGWGGAAVPQDLFSGTFGGGGTAPRDRGFAEAPLDRVDVDSDSEDEIDVPMPPVQRFDPVPAHARGMVEAFPSPVDEASSPFPSIHVATPAEAAGKRRHPDPRAFVAGMSGGAGQPPGMAAKLNRNWIRSAPGQDRIYEEDDFASEDDLASGRRRFAPPSPTEETSGRLLADARRRYEREWAMELESVEEARASAQDVGRGPSAAPSRAQERRAARRLEEADVASDGAALPPGAPKSGARASPYIGKKGSKPIPKGRGMWKILGRPPARILKKQKEADVAKVFGFGKQRSRRRNLGHGLSWDEAKDKWMGWYQRTKSSNFDRVQMAASPKKQDVEEAFEERKRRFQRRGRRTKERSGRDRNEAADPDMDV